MFTFDYKTRVRYADTDRMGYCYYGNYSRYFEAARVEALRSVGITYKDLEDSGVHLPVLEYSIKYFKPAFYDDELIIKVIIDVIPKVKFLIKYQTFKGKEKINEGYTTLVFYSPETKKPIAAPSIFTEKFNVE